MIGTSLAGAADDRGDLSVVRGYATEIGRGGRVIRLAVAVVVAPAAPPSRDPRAHP